MGPRPLTLRALRNYVTAVRGLLAGETVTIDGQPARMLHAAGLTAPRPVDVELWLSVFGPRGLELADQIADGIIGLPVRQRLPTATLVAGTVLDPGEDHDSGRVREAVGLWMELPRGKRHRGTRRGGCDARRANLAGGG